MKNLFYLLLLFVIFFSCDDDDDNNDNENWNANATVIEQGLDCGDSFLIQFSNDANVPANDFENIFYEINLPEAYKVNGLEINVDFREPTESESMACTDFGIAYPQIYIIEVNE